MPWMAHVARKHGAQPISTAVLKSGILRLDLPTQSLRSASGAAHARLHVRVRKVRHARPGGTARQRTQLPTCLPCGWMLALQMSSEKPWYIYKVYKQLDRMDAYAARTGTEPLYHQSATVDMDWRPPDRYGPAPAPAAPRSSGANGGMHAGEAPSYSHAPASRPVQAVASKGTCPAAAPARTRHIAVDAALKSTRTARTVL